MSETTERKESGLPYPIHETPRKITSGPHGPRSAPEPRPLGDVLAILDAALFEYVPEPGDDHAAQGLDRIGWLSGLLDIVNEGPDCVQASIDTDPDAWLTMQAEVGVIIGHLRDLVKIRRAAINAQPVGAPPREPGEAVEGEASEVARLRAIIERDRTDVARVLARLEATLRSWSWLAEGSRGSYEWDDDGYYDEIGRCFDELRPSLAFLRTIASDHGDGLATTAQVREARKLCRTLPPSSQSEPREQEGR